MTFGIFMGFKIQLFIRVRVPYVANFYMLDMFMLTNVKKALIKMQYYKNVPKKNIYLTIIVKYFRNSSEVYIEKAYFIDWVIAASCDDVIINPW
jgi:hypothetical protein